MDIFIIDNKWVFYISVFLVITVLLGLYLLREYHKVFSLRRYKLSEEILALYSKIKKRNEDNEDFSTEQIENFCNKFIPEENKKEIIELFKERDFRSLSVFCKKEKRIELDDALIKMSNWAVENGFNLLYLSCQRHPIEFINLIENEMKKNSITKDIKTEWVKRKKQLLIIDAHTNHFGFKEDVYRKKTKSLVETKGIPIVTANFSFVGIHSAIVHGYETILQTSGRGKKPSLLIYDSCYALTDLENEKLYRIFLKHVIPSERLLGGNITVFAEQWLPPEIENFVEAIVDVEIHDKNETQKI
jgi:hypothetical protein